MNVLLVDDQVRILEATRKLVDWEKLGVDQVFTAECAGDARAILSAHPIDIMLTDIEMPEENGIELHRWQTRHFPEVACVFMTSHANFAYAQEALRNGALDYILQPATIPEIEAALARCIKVCAEKESLAELGRGIDDALAKALTNGLEWSHWMLRDDAEMVRNQIVNMLDYAEAEGKLTGAYLQRVHHAFMEACAIACYGRKIDPTAMVSGDMDYERAMQAYGTKEELLAAVEHCLKMFEALSGPGAGQKAGTERRIKDVLRYLEENLYKMISRREAAKYVFLNEDYFSRAFRKETGMGYKEYVLKLKMEYAGKLLTHTELSVTTIASKVGYGNYNNFTQMFRKVVGVTPTEYRKQNGGHSEE